MRRDNARDLSDDRRAPRGKKWLASADDVGDTIPRHLRNRFERWFNEWEAKLGHKLMLLLFHHVENMKEVHVVAGIVKSSVDRYGPISPSCAVCNKEVTTSPACPISGEMLWMIPRETLPRKIRESSMMIVALMCPTCKIGVEREANMRQQAQVIEMLLDHLVPVRR